MIPQRVLGTTTLRVRVDACRKRLRVIRAIHKAQIHTEIEEPSELFLLQEGPTYDPGKDELAVSILDPEKAEIT